MSTTSKLSKIAFTTFLILSLAASASAATSDNQTEIFNTSEISFNDTYTTDVFTAQEVSNFAVSTNLSNGSEINATLKVYNDTELADSFNYQITGGDSNFTVNTTNETGDTYLFQFDAGNVSVESLNLSVTGIESTASPSPAAPATGGFFQGGIPVVQGVIDTVAAIPDFVSNLLNSIMEALPIP